jgi:addiction module HigA family antidote
MPIVSDKSTPVRLVPPGRILRRELDGRGWTQKEFSEMIDLSEKAISAIVNGKKQIMPETALKFAAALGGSAQFWLNLEANYRLGLAQREVDDTALEAIRTRSAARMEEDLSSVESVVDDLTAQAKPETLDLPVDSSLEADLVHEAQREGVSLEEFVAQVLREKIYK